MALKLKISTNNWILNETINKGISNLFIVSFSQFAICCLLQFGKLIIMMLHWKLKRLSNEKSKRTKLKATLSPQSKKNVAN